MLGLLEATIADEPLWLEDAASLAVGSDRPLEAPLAVLALEELLKPN